MLTTFIIPNIGRPTLQRSIDSALATGAKVLTMEDVDRGNRSEIRNTLIRSADTEWVSFLDDDDTVFCEYVKRLEEEITAHSEADVIHFRQYFIETGILFPALPVVEWGNVGICFSVRRELALRFPFVEQPYEDFEFVKRLAEKGYKIHFSKYITYKARH